MNSMPMPIISIVCFLILRAAIAAQSNYKCGCGPHFVNPTSPGYTVYQLLHNKVTLVLNPELQFERQSAGFEVGSSGLSRSDINNLINNNTILPQERSVTIHLEKRSYGGLKTRWGTVTCGKVVHGSFIIVNVGEPPIIRLVPVQACKKVVSVCGHVTGTPAAHVVIKINNKKRSQLITLSHGSFCSNVRPRADSFTLSVVATNCFGQVTMAVVVTQDQLGSCLTTNFSNTHINKNVTNCFKYDNLRGQGPPVTCGTPSTTTTTQQQTIKQSAKITQQFKTEQPMHFATERSAILTTKSKSEVFPPETEHTTKATDVTQKYSTSQKSAQTVKPQSTPTSTNTQQTQHSTNAPNVLDCPDRSQMPKQDKDDNQYPKELIIALDATVGGILVTGVILILLCLHKRNRRECRNDENQHSSSEMRTKTPSDPARDLSKPEPDLFSEDYNSESTGFHSEEEHTKSTRI
ncbi:uncharacterized protein LOC134177054 [Corticium candelabrum]|uniref:uncharacterized protein LOC134177054 n=1 Tax=Corticium candelabrum TaxID=121492 RepID=UPI002E2635AA|nr:uncharacterized protein LOC134177054 [Corticium candelabrum]